MIQLVILCHQNHYMAFLNPFALSLASKRMVDWTSAVRNLAMILFACQCLMVAQRPTAMIGVILLVLQALPQKEVDQTVLHYLYHHRHYCVTHVRH